MKAFFFLSAVSSGTVTINADSSVQILAEEAVPMERLDLQVKHLGELWAAVISGIIIKCGQKIICIECMEWLLDPYKISRFQEYFL